MREMLRDGLRCGDMRSDRAEMPVSARARQAESCEMRRDSFRYGLQREMCVMNYTCKC